MKKRKRILTALTAAFLSVTAVSPYVSSAEDAPENKVLLAELEKRADEYMAENGYKEVSEDVYNVYDAMIFKEKKGKWYFAKSKLGNEEQPDQAYCWINPKGIYLHLETVDGIDEKDISNFVKTNFPDNNSFEILNYTRGDYTKFKCKISGENDKINSEIKEIVKVLKENKLINTAEISYGTFSTNITGWKTFFLQPVSWFSSVDQFKDRGIQGITFKNPFDFETSRQDIINSYIAGDFECGEFGLVVNNSKLPDGVEAKVFEECYPYNTQYMLAEGTYGIIPLTREEAANLDKEVLESSHYFYAKPDEMTIVNQSNLIADIFKEIPVIAFESGTLESSSKTECDGTGFDITNAVNGDANCDERFSIADATAILQHLGNPDEYGLSLKGMYNADCGGVMDGVTAADAMFIQSKLAKG